MTGGRAWDGALSVVCAEPPGGTGWGARVASDGGRVARGTGAVPPCAQGGIWEDWQPASSNNTAIDHGWARRRERQAKKPVIGGVNFSPSGGGSREKPRTNKA